MRVAIFTETFLPKIDGVVTRVVRTLEQLAELGHEALVFAPHDPPAEVAGHRVVPVPAISFRPWYPELFLGLPRPRLGRELDAFAPDVVHVVNPVILGLWGTMVANQRDLPLLASYHTDITQYAVHLRLPFLSPISRVFLRDVHNRAHVNLCTSQPMVNSARGLGIQRVRLMTNNPEKIAQLERYGIEVAARVPHSFPSNGHNENYLRTKAERAGHLL
jgi:glycosyltransferase involved in cell wall biosynthesis